MDNLIDLPTEILLEIITRLPTESILVCKSVCRLWRYLVSHHPSFRRMHLTRLNQSADSSKLSFVVLAGDAHLYYFEYDDSHDETPIYCSIRRINISRLFSGFYNLISSINGLICLHGWRDHVYYICNPVTREYIKFPSIKRDFGEQYDHLSSGFGYVHSTNEFKVVELYKLGRESSFIEVAVYTLGNGHGWRYVGRYANKSFTNNSGAFLKGALHWVDHREGNVFVFDLAEEKFREHVSPPPGIVGDYFLGVLGGVLYCAIKQCSQITKRMFSDIWFPDSSRETKEQVEQQILGWSKEFFTYRRKPFALTKSGSVLYFDDWGLTIYDAVASTLKKLVHSEEFHDVIPYKNTLVSLKELGKQDVKIMESAEVNSESLFFIQSHQDQIPELINWKRLWKIWTSEQGAGRGSHLTTQGFTFPLDPKEGVIQLSDVFSFYTLS